MDRFKAIGKRMRHSVFAKNLRRLCDRQESVAQVCRSIQINRQQFNKYLNGTVIPSRNNMERICNFFGIDRNLIFLPEQEFQLSIAALPSFAVGSYKQSHDLNNLLDSLPNSVEMLAHYCGYYHCYSHALGYPGFIARTLIKISQIQTRFYTHTIEHLWDKRVLAGPRNRFKYRGLAFYLADRIYLTQYEVLNNQDLYHTILYPSYRRNIGFLSGVMIGVGSMNYHIPQAGRVELQYLGNPVDARHALAQCGLYALDTGEINDEIKERITNSIDSDEFLLTGLGR